MATPACSMSLASTTPSAAATIELTKNPGAVRITRERLSLDGSCVSVVKSGPPGPRQSVCQHIEWSPEVQAFRCGPVLCSPHGPRGLHRRTSDPRGGGERGVRRPPWQREATPGEGSARRAWLVGPIVPRTRAFPRPSRPTIRATRTRRRHALDVEFGAPGSCSPGHDQPGDVGSQCDAARVGATRAIRRRCGCCGMAPDDPGAART